MPTTVLLALTEEHRKTLEVKLKDGPFPITVSEEMIDRAIEAGGITDPQEIKNLRDLEGKVITIESLTPRTTP